MEFDYTAVAEQLGISEDEPKNLFENMAEGPIDMASIVEAFRRQRGRSNGCSGYAWDGYAQF